MRIKETSVRLFDKKIAGSGKDNVKNSRMRTGTGRRRCRAAATRRFRSVVDQVTFYRSEGLVALLFVVATDLDRISDCRPMMMIGTCGISVRFGEGRANEIVQVDWHRQRGRTALAPVAGVVCRACLLVARRARAVARTGRRTFVRRRGNAGSAGAHHRPRMSGRIRRSLA